jgi:hypothetical protein
VQEATTTLSQANPHPKDNVNTPSAQSTTPDATQSTTARTSPPAPPRAPQPDPSTELTRSATPDTIDIDVDAENEGTTRMTEHIQCLDKAPEDEDESEIPQAPKKKRRMRKKEKCYITDDTTRNRYYDTNMKCLSESVESLGACTGCYGFLYLKK